MSVREDSESRGYASLHDMKLSSPIDTEHDKLGDSCLRCSIVDYVDGSLERGCGALEQRHLSVGE